MSSSSERRLVAIFNETDHWWAQRAAASGSGGDADLPDVTFAHDGTAFAAEEKETSEPYIYVQPDEIEALEAYAAAYGMTPCVIGRFKGERAYYVWHPEAMARTNAGTYRGAPDYDHEAGGWAVKLADPDGAADGIYPAELSAFALYHALHSQLTGGLTEAPPNDDPVVVPPDTGYHYNHLHNGGD